MCRIKDFNIFLAVLPPLIVNAIIRPIHTIYIVPSEFNIPSTPSDSRLRHSNLTLRHQRIMCISPTNNAQWILAFPAECFENITYGYVFGGNKSNGDNKNLSLLHETHTAARLFLYMVVNAMQNRDGRHRLCRRRNNIGI